MTTPTTLEERFEDAFAHEVSERYQRFSNDRVDFVEIKAFIHQEILLDRATTIRKCIEAINKDISELNPHEHQTHYSGLFVAKESIEALLKT